MFIYFTLYVCQYHSHSIVLAVRITIKPTDRLNIENLPFYIKRGEKGYTIVFLLFSITFPISAHFIDSILKKCIKFHILCVHSNNLMKILYVRIEF